MRRRVRLTESDLHRIVRESVYKTLYEQEEFDRKKSISKQIGKMMRDKNGIKKAAERRKKFGGRTLGQLTDDELKGLDENIIHRTVKRVLREWADGTETTQAYHVMTVGADDSDQEEADFAYEIYDALTHNQMTADEAIKEITNGDLTADSDIEVVPRSAHNFGYSDDGQYFLTYDQYTGAFDVWEVA